MGALIRSLDWAATPLGPIEAWPQALRGALNICLNSRFPMLVWWGPELRLLYNDAYRPILGATKHPRALGAPGHAIWHEIWDIVGPTLTGVLERAEATWSDNELLLLDRNGYVEECYFTFSHGPIRDNSGQVGGIFTAVQETTQQVLSERRMDALRALAAELGGARTTADACAIAARSLAQHPRDLPFVLLYLLDQASMRLQLAGSAGLAAGTPAAPEAVELAAGAGPWPFTAVAASHAGVTVDLPAAPLEDLMVEQASAPVRQAAVLPLAGEGREGLAGFLVAGISPRLALDDPYWRFLQLAADQISTAVAKARAHEEERHRAAEIAHERHRVLELFEQSPAAICVLRGPEHVFEIVNPVYLRVVGRASADDLLGKPLLEALPELRGQGYAKILDDVYRTGEPFTGAEQQVWLDRHGTGKLEEAYFDLVYRPFRSAAGAIEAVFAHGVDVTEQVMARRRVEQSETQLRLITDTLPALICYIDPEYRYQFNNHAYVEWFGRSPADLTGRHVADNIGPEEFARLKPYLDRALAGERVSYETEIQTLTGRRSVLATYIPDISPDGTVLGYAALVTDISERKRTEAQIQAAQRMDAVGRLAGGVAHEINNSLTGVLGFTEFLLRSLDLDDPRREDAEQVKRSAQRAATVTQQLLAFSRRQMLRPSVLDLAQIVNDFTPMLRQTLGPDKELMLRPAPDPVLVKADRGQLEQVLLNLALNARDAMPRGGRMTVEVTREVAATRRRVGARQTELPPGRYACLKVTDTGHGMDEATQARLFEPFFTTKEPGRGTGLGLATTYGIVRQSGGYIAFESAPGCGTAFTVYLPEAAEASDAAPPAPGVPGLRRGAEAILVVDDEPIVLGFIARLLRDQGYTVYEAQNGEQALQELAARGERIRLVISDLVMPGVSGHELAARIAATHPTVPVLFTSGYTDDEVLRRGLLDPGAAFAGKPLDPEFLLRRARTILDAPLPNRSASGTD